MSLGIYRLIYFANLLSRRRAKTVIDSSSDETEEVGNGDNHGNGVDDANSENHSETSSSSNGDTEDDEFNDFKSPNRSTKRPLTRKRSKVHEKAIDGGDKKKKVTKGRKRRVEVSTDDEPDGDDEKAEESDEEAEDSVEVRTFKGYS